MSDIDAAVGATYVYDVSAIGSSAPPLLGTVPSGNYSHSSWASSDGTILITAQEVEDGKLQIWNIADPSSPVLLSTLDRTSLSLDATSPHNPVLFNDTLLFVSWLEAGLLVFDISDPSSPLQVGIYDTYPDPSQGLYDGLWGVYPFLGLDRILLSDGYGGLFVVAANSVPIVPSLGPLGIALLCCLLGLAGYLKGRA